MDNERSNQWQAMALSLAQSGTFYLNDEESLYPDTIADAWDKVESFEDFFELVTSLVETADACIECLGYETPEERLMFLFHQGEEMKRLTRNA